VYKYHGYGGWTGSYRGNSVKGHQIGPHVVEFGDGATVEWTLPHLWLRGIMWGDRILEYEGTMKFRDTTNGFSCDLTINPDSGINGLKRFFSSKARRGNDTAVGVVHRAAAPGAEGEVVATVEGCWLEHLDFDAKRCRPLALK
jgi:hypothetical protein